ncbi:E3.1.11.2 [Mytilus edulis]|uniref:E3.1.11.2 n=1 Tax=Mytilus edulis TaxID=6550 RepID=A0A8S3SYG2_MYTED|nr:E3.1.11.2 [Mytilus edulis]
MCIKVSRNVSITSWNVNGLFRKLSGDRICKLDDENFSNIMTSDIVCLSETHASSKDILFYNGYKCFTNCRQSKTNRSKIFLEGNIALIGDLNAHINVSESDYITNEIDDSLDDFLPINYIADAVLKSRSTEISQNTNSYGKQLIELCISAQLRILNGRTLGDSKGKVTFFNHNGTSIDDYCICSSGFLPSIINFSINKFDPTVSDHCPITVNIMSQIKRQPPENLKTPLKCIKWSNEYENTFKLNLLKTDFQPIISEIESLAEIPVQNNLSSVEEKLMKMFLTYHLYCIMLLFLV